MTQSTKTPELFVEKLVLGELDAAAARQVRQRLEDEGGLGRIDALTASNDAILSEYAPAQLAASIRMRHEIVAQEKWKKRRLALLPLSAAVAAAAAVMMFMVFPMNPQNTPMDVTGKGDRAGAATADPYTGIKGDGQPKLHVGKRTLDGQVWLKNGASVAAGDALQIKFNAGEARSLVICSVDGNGEVTLHYPQSEEESTKVAPMSAKTLPFGYTLDDAPGFERFILVWSKSDQPMAVNDVIRSVAQLKDARSGVPELDGEYQFKDMMLRK